MIWLERILLCDFTVTQSSTEITWSKICAKLNLRYIPILTREGASDYKAYYIDFPCCQDQSSSETRPV